MAQIRSHPATLALDPEIKGGSSAPELKETKLPNQLILVPRKRIPDYQKPPKDSDIFLFIKSPLKPYSGTRYGGSKLAGTGFYEKSSKKDPRITKHYYLANHGFVEYLAFETLQAIGFFTPKSRLVEKPINKNNFVMASRVFENAVPIRAFRDRIDEELINNIPEYKKIKTIAEQYTINVGLQTMDYSPDMKEVTHRYKIRGQLFCADLAGLLIGDGDLHPQQENILLVRKGNSYLAVLIDKDIDPSNFGLSYKDLHDKLTANRKNILLNSLFSSREPDQVLAIIHALSKLLSSGAGCVINQIFNHPRVLRTTVFLIENNESLAVKNESYCERFKLTIDSFIKHFLNEYGVDCLERFATREQVREQIAARVIQELKLPGYLQPYIIEDLRGPYYKDYISEKPYSLNEEGFAQLKKDLINEFFHDISGLQHIFETHMQNYHGDANREIALGIIRDLFKELLSKELPPTQSKISIILGCLLKERDKAQKEHTSQWIRKKSISTFAGKIDSIIKEFCHLTFENKQFCEKAYEDYLESKPKQEVRKDLVSRVIATYWG